MSKAKVLCALLLVCCAEGGTEQAKSGDSSSLNGLLKEHGDLTQALAAVPASEREECELHSGDCLVLVRERREKLVASHGLSSCPGNGEDCLFTQLEGKGKQSEVSEYVTFKNWCMKEVLGCTDKAGAQAKTRSTEEKAQKRLQKIELSPSALAAGNEVETGRQRVDYLRKTLPPKAGEGVCELSDVASCQKQVEQQQKDFSATLTADDFDEPKAVEAYTAIKRSEAACFEPELKCLSDALNPYGMFPESRKLLEQNFTRIAERQKLVASAAPDAELACVADLEAEQTPAIEAAFKEYSRKPILFNRMRLEKTYISLHEAQIACLTKKAKAAPPPGEGKVIELD
ncbi:MAG TPA: hypothetical protein VM686_38815 [Polyangiaceae bacterium]|nr:hypothetical protein [Polyangiaceae bacterium]